jgi:hypothetical protein
MKKDLIKKFCKENKVELFDKLNIKFEDGIFYSDGMGVFGNRDNDGGIDVSLIEGVLIEDVYNKIEKVEIGGKVLFINDYR